MPVPEHPSAPEPARARGHPDLSIRRYRSSLRTLLWLAFALRLYFVVFVHSPRDYVFSDMESYHSVALELLSGLASPWHAFRPVGYSMLLALLYVLSDASRTLVGVVQAAMGAALVPLTAALARSAGASRKTALISALTVALSVPLVFYCGLLLTEVPTCFFLMLGLVLAVTRRARDSRGARVRLALAGLSLGIAAALRPNLLAVCPVIAAFVALRDGGTLGLRRTWRGALVLVFALALPVMMVSAYNSRVLARPAGPAANGGLNFYLNFADVRSIQYQGPFGGYWVSPIPNGFRYTRHEFTAVPFFAERHYYAAGVKYVREHPRALLLSLRNFVEAAGVGNQLYWPNWPGYEALFRGYALFFFGAVLVPALGWQLALVWGRVRARARAQALLIAALCLVSALPMYLFLGDPRVRVPFDPLWIVLAGLACQGALRAALALRAPREPSG
jgi:4-amino-4-deoxy-L-arabinose transferase-like glycosyltransferase